MKGGQKERRHDRVTLAAVSRVCRLADKSQEAAGLFRTMSCARERAERGGFLCVAEGSEVDVSGWQRWRFQRLPELLARKSAILNKRREIRRLLRRRRCRIRREQSATDRKRPEYRQLSVAFVAKTFWV